MGNILLNIANIIGSHGYICYWVMTRYQPTGEWLWESRVFFLDGIFGISPKFPESYRIWEESQESHQNLRNHLKIPERIYLESLRIFLKSVPKFRIFGISCQNNQLIHPSVPAIINTSNILKITVLSRQFTVPISLAMPPFLFMYFLFFHTFIFFFNLETLRYRPYQY